MNNRISFFECIDGEKGITYEECNRFWESGDSKVHSDTSDGLMKELADHIEKRMELNDNDVLLVIGGGGGYIDRFLTSRVNILIGIDFSQQKTDAAKKRNPGAVYYKQDFLDSYEYLKEYSINKIYSYSVMQYCKPEDFDRFIQKQINVLDLSKKCLIGHLDVPDVDKAYYYYDIYCNDVTEDIIDKNRDKIRFLIGDGSCWHDMKKITQSLSKMEMVKKIDILDAHYWKFRSDIVIEL